MAAHLYWSLNFTATNGDTFYTVFDVDMRATVAGADQCSGGTASATSGVAADGFDNNSSTAWVSNSTTERLTYQFAAPVDVAEYALIGNGNQGSRAPKDWTFEWSDDGTNWTVIDTIVGETGWAIGEKRSYQLPASFTELDNVGGLVISSLAETILHTPDLFVESDAVGSVKISSLAEMVFWEEVIDVRSGLKLSATEDSASFITSQGDGMGGLNLSSTAEGAAWVAYTLGGLFKLSGLQVTGDFLRNIEGSLKPLGFRTTGTINAGQAAIGQFKPLGFQVAGAFVQFGGVVKITGLRISGGTATGNTVSGAIKPTGLLVAGTIQTQGMLQGSFKPLGLRILGSIDSGQASTGTASLIRFSVVGSLSAGNAIAGSVGLVLLRADGSAMSSGSMAGQFMIINLAAYGSYSRVQR